MSSKFIISGCTILINVNLGEIRCRLPRTSLKELGRYLSTSHQRTEGPYFIIRERSRPQDSVQVLISDETLWGLRFGRKWKMKHLTIAMSSPVAITEIVLCIKKDEEFPISGFPRSLQDEDLRSSKWLCPPPTISNSN